MLLRSNLSLNIAVLEERCVLVVECLTGYRRNAGFSLTKGTAICPEKDTYFIISLVLNHPRKRCDQKMLPGV